jgi:hypothetical protein
MHLMRYWGGADVSPFPNCHYSVPPSAYEVIEGPFMTREEWEKRSNA